MGGGACAGFFRPEHGAMTHFLCIVILDAEKMNLPFWSSISTAMSHSWFIAKNPRCMARPCKVKRQGMMHPWSIWSTQTRKRVGIVMETSTQSTPAAPENTTPGPSQDFPRLRSNSTVSGQGIHEVRWRWWSDIPIVRFPHRWDFGAISYPMVHAQLVSYVVARKNRKNRPFCGFHSNALWVHPQWLLKTGRIGNLK